MRPRDALDELTDALGRLIDDPTPGAPQDAAEVIDMALERLYVIRSRAVNECDGGWTRRWVLPPVVRGPEPDLNRAAIRGNARRLLADRSSA